MVILAGLILGLGSSLHCVGMCGPLSLAMVGNSGSSWRLTLQMAQYHLGRILTYASLGLIAGTLGLGMQVAGIQQIVAMSAGALLITAAFAPFLVERYIYKIPIINTGVRLLSKQFGKLKNPNSFGGRLLAGALHGFMPCGMVYLALAGAISTYTPAMGSLFMLTFGLGTIPSLLAFGLSGQAVLRNHRSLFKYGQAALLFISGSLLLWKGIKMDLSILSGVVPMAGYDCH